MSLERTGQSRASIISFLRECGAGERELLAVFSSLSGKVGIQDLSLIFREDVEPRTLVRFMILANIVEPVPLADTLIYDIDSQHIDVIHVGQDEVRTEIEVDVHRNESS